MARAESAPAGAPRARAMRGAASGASASRRAEEEAGSRGLVRRVEAGGIGGAERRARPARLCLCRPASCVHARG